ncbi:hypothetical protein GQ42DRAFT_160922 [Ramicandelaber brevisporus]|nr:hypothetical protein GQ42DRAFT_160922 [Ramicandelaber brevisporus]
MSNVPAQLANLTKAQRKAHQAMVAAGLTPRSDVQSAYFNIDRGTFAMQAPLCYSDASETVYMFMGKLIPYGGGSGGAPRMSPADMQAAMANLNALSGGAAPEAFGTGPESKSLAEDILQDGANAQAAATVAAAASGEGDEEVDATGIPEDDIAIVMNQASVPRSKAVRALKASDGDVLNAIMNMQDL